MATGTDSLPVERGLPVPLSAHPCRCPSPPLFLLTNNDVWLLASAIREIRPGHERDTAIVVTHDGREYSAPLCWDLFPLEQIGQQIEDSAEWIWPKRTSS